MTLVKLSTKGQIVLPKHIREALDLRPGTVLKVMHQGQHVILEPVATSMIDRLHGKFAGGALLNDLEAEHRREVERDLRP